MNPAIICWRWRCLTEDHLHEGAATMLRNLVRRLLAFILVYSGFVWLRYVLRGYHRNSMRIICYHSVTEKERENFERHIRNYSEKYDIISMTDVVSIVNSRRSHPGRCLAITFDDGFKDNYEIVMPILQKYSIPACFFVVPQFVSVEEEDKEKLEYFSEEVFHTSDVKRNMSWAEVRKLRQLGFEIGSHTRTHALLTKLPIEEARHELLESKRMIEDEIGQQDLHFAFPYGTAADFNPDLGRLVKEIGYTSCSSITKGFNSPNSDPFYLCRNVIFPHWPLFVVKCFIQGGFDWTVAFKRHLSHVRHYLSRLPYYRRHISNLRGH